MPLFNFFQREPAIRDKRIALNRAIKNLANGYRTAFLLREVLGYSNLEIAKILNVTEGTIKSQNYKAKERLRETLESR